MFIYIYIYNAYIYISVRVWLAMFSFASHAPDMSLAASSFASERRSTALDARPIAARRRDENLRSPNEAARFDRIHPVLPISPTISLLRSLLLSSFLSTRFPFFSIVSRYRVRLADFR